MEIKNVGISIPSIGNTANPANTPGTRKVQKLIVSGPALLGQPPYEVTQTTHLTEQGELIEETIVMAAVCKSCGTVFKSDSDATAMCNDCYHLLCRDCASKYKCQDCGKQSCARCGWTFNGEFYCLLCGFRHRPGY